MFVGAVGVALDRDGGQRLIRVLLVRDAELVPADHLGGGDHLPFGGTAEVLSLEGGVAEDRGGRDHGEEVRGGHSGPGFVEEGGVVYDEGWGDDAGEAAPVLQWVVVVSGERGLGRCRERSGGGLLRGSGREGPFRVLWSHSYQPTRSRRR